MADPNSSFTFSHRSRFTAVSRLQVPGYPWASDLSNTYRAFMRRLHAYRVEALLL